MSTAAMHPPVVLHSILHNLRAGYYVVAESNDIDQAMMSLRSGTQGGAATVDDLDDSAVPCGHFGFPLNLGDYCENPNLLTDTAHELALFGGRLILAHNRLLFPGRKQFLRQLERAREQPARFPWLLRRLLRQPCIPTAEAFCEAVLAFRAWPTPAEGQGARYVRDRDEAWLYRPAALAES